MNNLPIGVFDSGLGGLSVWRELRRSLPHESIVYFGDGANCPYGEKTEAEVLEYIEQGVLRLLGKDVKMIVLACNTATTIGVKYLRGRYDIPFVGMEPALKPAAGSSSTGVVGVLATKATLHSEWFADLKSRYTGKARIVTAEGQGFVGLVENGLENTPEALETVRKAVTPMIEAGADRIVLGCTHYPFLADRIREVAGMESVEIIDPAPAIVRRVEWLLDESDMRASKSNVPFYDYLTAGDEEYLEKIVAKAESCI